MHMVNGGPGVGLHRGHVPVAISRELVQVADKTAGLSAYAPYLRTTLSAGLVELPNEGIDVGAHG
jgi:hypothetical protein